LRRQGDEHNQQTGGSEANPVACKSNAKPRQGGEVSHNAS
jgi:hypothetical protein